MVNYRQSVVSVGDWSRLQELLTSCNFNACNYNTDSAVNLQRAFNYVTNVLTLKTEFKTRNAENKKSGEKDP